jgi:hypothetical protein
MLSMDARGRLFIELLLVVALVGIGLYAFNQYGVLTNTQNNLDEISQNSTALAGEAAANASQAASDLESANSTSTQSAAEANSTSTENSQIIASNYSTETRVAVVNATNEQRLESTGTQSAENAAATSSQVAEENSLAQANLASTSTQAANNANNRLENANATSTEAAGNANATSTEVAANANATSTEVRANVSSANATSTEALANANARGTDAANDAGTEIASLSNDIADIEAELAQVLEDLETADATIEAQQAQINDLRETSENNTSSNTGSSVLVETRSFEISLSEDYIVLNFEEEYDDTLDELYDMGGEFESFAEILDENDDFFVIGAVLSEDADDYAPEIMFVYPLESLFVISMEDYIDTFFDEAEEGAEYLDSEVLDLGEQEVGRVVVGFDDDEDAHRVHYVVEDDRVYWHIVFFTLSRDFEDRLEEFDASMATFRLR